MPETGTSPASTRRLGGRPPRTGPGAAFGRPVPRYTPKGPLLGALLESEEAITARALVHLVLRSNLDAVHKRELVRNILGMTKVDLAAEIIKNEKARDQRPGPLTRQAVSKVFRGSSRSERVEQGLADIFEVEPALLFPEWVEPSSRSVR